eukprot:TRINITY_DN2301_c0_g1::TRINITY_DN2301_c0_g1_i1::g.6896::m.6896 TRINITY_DN2301_c0_g1::TRINITY_DN2301_c0_g1_i1::g.6896  ORF type:complete len:513 (+),score=217.50,sp/Q8VZ10/SOQ1_ARATH/29.54/7e-20,sp/Q8VZ10/SOQ1_ARATH/29.39/1e-16,sp/Q8VZ10/SOQ1_ARATH/32.88/6e-08,NHL/PF01436.16/8e-09,NHL/PF01436.16/0.019,NHL/PF01436.16/2.3e-08,NHL/PF01436.16/0.017,NHL/PF01436.16/0.006,BTB/PF00651.26/2.8e-22,SGL/PF08450.7/0.0056,SGL/PF08450.7/4.5e-06,SGL/PF08450.7/1e+02,DUF839/PF05787.8/0.00097,DUF839/PF05787.8/1.1e+0
MAKKTVSTKIAKGQLIAAPHRIRGRDTGELFLVCPEPAYILRVSESGEVSIFAGNGQKGYQDGPANMAMFNNPTGIALDGEGNIFVADSGNHRIRKITSDGTVSTFSGTGNASYTNGNLTTAEYNTPVDLAFAADSTLYIVDSANHRIRKVTTDGNVNTIAGSGKPGKTDGFMTGASFNEPKGIAIADDGTIYVADSGNHCIRQIQPDGTVKVFAGDAEKSGSDDGEAHKALFNKPSHLVVDGENAVFVADSGNNSIRMIQEKTVTTIAGGPDGGFSNPTGLYIDVNYQLYVCDEGNQQVISVHANAKPANPYIVPPSTLQRDLAALLKEELVVNVHFKVGDEVFKADKAIVAARCSYFHKMFTGGFRESESTDAVQVIPISDTTPAAFRAALEFLYSDALNVPRENVMEVLELSRRFMLERLSAWCQRIIAEDVEESNAVEMLLWVTPQREDYPELRRYGFNYVIRHYKKIREKFPDTLSALSANKELEEEINKIVGNL